MKQEKNSNKTRLKTWLWNKPLVFMFSFLGLSIGFCLLYSLVQMVFDIETIVPVYALCFMSFVLAIYYALRRLPGDKMPQTDFVAIVNGANIISLATSFIAIIGAVFYNGNSLQLRMSILYLLNSHTAVFFTLVAFLLLLSLYLIGVAVSSIYAKYVRSRTFGISKWKIILSMPFAFLMLWTPGYLIRGKDIKSELEIKSNWYSKFNKWTLANFNNLLFIFLLLLLCKNVISGLATIVLSVALLIIYGLWYTKYKSEFVKNINRGYALTAVGINLAMLLAIITQVL